MLASLMGTDFSASSPLLIQFPVNMAEKAAENSSGVWAPAIDMQDMEKLLAASFGLAQF